MASPWGDCVVRVPLDNPDNRVLIPTTPERPKKKEAAKVEPPTCRESRRRFRYEDYFETRSWQIDTTQIDSMTRLGGGTVSFRSVISLRISAAVSG